MDRVDPPVDLQLQVTRLDGGGGEEDKRTRFSIESILGRQEQEVDDRPCQTSSLVQEETLVSTQPLVYGMFNQTYALAQIKNV